MGNKLSMTEQEKLLEFISFCIEMYSKKHNQSGSVTEEIFEKSNVFEYLQNSYDVLHTQGENYIVSTIEEFLEVK